MRGRSTEPCAGAGAGNSPTEILATVFESLDVPTGVDVDAVLAAAENIVKPMITTRLPVADRASTVQGRFGVYNSFLLHAERAAHRYGAAHDILRRVGEAGYVGGQEDMIIDVAIELAGRDRRATVAG